MVLKANVIVTHPKRAHRDDFLTCCLLMHLLGGSVPVHRRMPTREDLQSAEVIVVDVGKVHDPACNNFDHHQFEDGPPQCALTLVLKALRVYSLARAMWDWVEPTEILDVRGFRHLVKWSGIPSAKRIMAMHSPIEKSLLKQFECALSLYPGNSLYEIMVAIGSDLMDDLDTAKRRIAVLRKENVVYTVPAGTAFRALPKNAGEMPVVLEIAVNRYFSDVDVVISDDRYHAGWLLYLRPKSQEQWDFRRVCKRKFDFTSIADEENGVWMKTNRPLDPEELNELLLIAAGEEAQV